MSAIDQIDDLVGFVENYEITNVKSDRKGVRVCVTGAGGFIGAHLCIRLRKEGYYVVGVDRKKHEYLKDDEFCDEFYKMDLRRFENCVKATANCEHVYNLAADMGGMGFIQSNESVLMWNNTMISCKVLEASRRNHVKRYFYSSSACCYNEKMQLDVNNPGLKESDAWPLWPQDTYGFEKVYAEEIAIIYGRDFDMQCRIARFHNIYGPVGTWFGGREKAPAAFCRKAAAANENDTIDIWGDGEQTRSFCYVDDCVEGILRIMFSDYDKPLNLGSDEMVTINELARLALSFDGKDDIQLKHIEGPLGVRGRNSENTLIKQVLGWAPQTSLKVGLKKTYDWIQEQIEKKRSEGCDENFLVSKVVTQNESMLDDINIDEDDDDDFEEVN